MTKKKNKGPITLERIQKGALLLARLAKSLQQAQASVPMPHDMDELIRRYTNMRNRFCGEYDREDKQVNLLTQQVIYFAGRVATQLYGMEKYVGRLQDTADELKKYKRRAKR